SVPFGIGVAATATSLIPAPGVLDPATQAPPPLDAAARWLNLLVAALALGGLPFALLVWRPAFRRGTIDDANQRSNVQTACPEPAEGFKRSNVAQWHTADEAMTRAIRRIILLGGALFLLTNLLFLLTQAAGAAGVPLAQALGAPALGLLGSRTGQLVLIRG